MTTTLDQIKKRLQEMGSKGNGKKNMLWKATDKHDIRLLPYPHSDEPIFELGFHYDIGKSKTVLCPKHNFGDECVICEFAAKLKSWKHEDGSDKSESEKKADFEAFKKIQVVVRYFAVVVERGKEAEGPKFWAFGKTNAQDLLKIVTNEDWNEGREDGGGYNILTSVDAAHDLQINFKAAKNKDGKGNDKNYPETEIVERKKETPLSKDKNVVKGLLDKIVPITEVYQRLTSTEVEKIFADFVNSTPVDEASSTTEGAVEYAANTSEKPIENGRSIEDAFEELTQ